MAIYYSTGMAVSVSTVEASAKLLNRKLYDEQIGEGNGFNMDLVRIVLSRFGVRYEVPPGGERTCESTNPAKIYPQLKLRLPGLGIGESAIMFLNEPHFVNLVRDRAGTGFVVLDPAGMVYDDVDLVYMSYKGERIFYFEGEYTIALSRRRTSIDRPHFVIQ